MGSDCFMCHEGMDEYFASISVTLLSLSVFSFCNQRTTGLAIFLKELGKSTFFSDICLEFKGVAGQPERRLGRQRHQA